MARETKMAPKWSVLAAVVITGLAPACGRGSIPGENIESFIESNLSFTAEEYQADCPDSVASVAGTTFTCTLTDKDDNQHQIEGDIFNDEGGIHIDFGQVPQTPKP